MATASITNTFVNQTPAEAAEVNENFSDVVSFLNNSVIHTDGTKAMTASFDAGSHKIVNLATPTTGTDAATKAYADALATSGATAVWTRTTNVSISAGDPGGIIQWENETNDVDGWGPTTSGGDVNAFFTCPADGVYTITVAVKKASGAGLPRIYLAPPNAWYFTARATVSTTSATAGASDGVTVFIPAGTVFSVVYTEISGVNSAVVDTFTLTITKVSEI